MALHFPYKRLSTRAPVVTLGGSQSRPYPLIGATVLGPTGTAFIRGLIDTGSDDTIFPETVATQIGLDLSQAPTGGASGVGLVAASLRYAEVTLRITDYQEQREWSAWVAFTPTPLKRSLLGYAGFLQFFTATFRGDVEEVELEINSLYPGT